MRRQLDVGVPRGPEAAAVARRLVREQLDEDVTRVVRAEVDLIVSELIANAVLHGVGAIRLRLEIDDDVVRGEVIDEGTGFEADVRTRGLDQVGGRGLWLVGSLAQRWGVHDGSSHVWFELPLQANSSGATPPKLGEERRPDELD